MEADTKRFNCISYSPLQNYRRCAVMKSFCSGRRLIGICVASLLTSFMVYSIYYSCDNDLPLWREYYLRYYATPLVKCEGNDLEGVQSKISYKDLLQDLETSPRTTCKCNQSLLPLKKKYIDDMEFVKSRCSPEATLLGVSQNVMSYTLFARQDIGEDDRLRFWRNYVAGVSKSLAGLHALYPGWVMRIYTNETLQGLMCDVVCADSDLYFCDVNQLDYLKTANPLTWRYAPLGDPTVKQFLSRDLGSKATERERKAVDYWEHSSFPFHNMRDHPKHSIEMGGGLWGGNNEKFCYGNGVNLLKKLTDIRWQKKKQQDEEILSNVIYKDLKNLIITHDSYHCQVFRDSLPWPTKRSLEMEFVGKVVPAVIFGFDEAQKTDVVKECPLRCRPTYGEDWLYC